MKMRGAWQKQSMKWDTTGRILCTFLETIEFFQSAPLTFNIHFMKRLWKMSALLSLKFEALLKEHLEDQSTTIFASDFLHPPKSMLNQFFLFAPDPRKLASILAIVGALPVRTTPKQLSNWLPVSPI
jgi:hypothetical protein